MSICYRHQINYRHHDEDDYIDDDDDDIAFNPYNVESGSDDTDANLDGDEDDDEVH